MGLFDFLKGKKDTDSDVRKTSDRKTVIVSNDRGYIAQAERNTNLTNLVERKKGTLRKELSSVSNQLPESELYSRHRGLQIKSQKNILEHFVSLVKQRFILSKTISKINNKWPENEPEVIDMIIESEKEVTIPNEVKKTWGNISEGSDTIDKDFRNRMFKMGQDINQSDYREYFKEDNIIKAKVLSERRFKK